MNVKDGFSRCVDASVWRVYRRALLAMCITRAAQLPDEIPSVRATCQGLDRTALSRTPAILRVVKVSLSPYTHVHPRKKCPRETFMVFLLARWQHRDIEIQTETTEDKICIQILRGETVTTDIINYYIWLVA